MVQINFAHKEIQCKIVYYGPGMSGKTTNLEVVHEKTPGESRGDLTSIATTGERTLYFDYMPLDLGSIAGIRTKFQLYTVPGQIYYKSTRRLVLQGVDGIVFVADSSASKIDENRESMRDLEENLREMGRAISDLPIVIQYNKRDLPDAMSVEDLEREVNAHRLPHFEAIATTGEGVFPTLKALATAVLESVNKGGIGGAKAPRPASASAPATAAAPAPVAVAAASESVTVEPGARPALAAAVARAPIAASAGASGATGGGGPGPSASATAVATPPAAKPALRPAYSAPPPPSFGPPVTTPSGKTVPSSSPFAAASANANGNVTTGLAATGGGGPLPGKAGAPGNAPPPLTLAPTPTAAPAAPARGGDAGGKSAPRSIEDRMVRVSGLGRPSGHGRVTAVLALGALIAAAVWFAVTSLL
jgi:signal recognition particle receptor subunit beta